MAATDALAHQRSTSRGSARCPLSPRMDTHWQNWEPWPYHLKTMFHKEMLGSLAHI